LRVPEEQVPLEDLVTSEDLTYQEYPIKLLDTSERVTRNKKIWMCKVQWSHRTEEEATWEREEELKAEFSNFFSESFESQGRIPFKRGRFVTPRKFKFKEKLKSFYKS
jgi:hypothetical protein